jgi:serine/threonine protein kinase
VTNLTTAHREAFEQRGVLHRDIHLSNLFIDEGDSDVDDVSPVAKGKAKAKANAKESKGMLGDWGAADFTRIPMPCNVKKPIELPVKPIVRQNHLPEYSDSEDDWWMQRLSRAPPPHPASAAKPSTRSSTRVRNKQPVRSRVKPKSPTMSDSQMSDATTVPDTDLEQIDLNEVYPMSNLWEDKAIKLLNRTVSRQPSAHQYY